MRTTAFLCTASIALTGLTAWNAAAPATARVSDTQLDEVLAQARKASGHAAWARLDGDLVFDGEADMASIESEFQLRFAGDGSFRLDLDGPLAGAQAWNGKTLWSNELGGPPHLMGPEAAAATLLTQWVHSGFWADGRAPLKIELVEQDDEVVVLSLAVEGTRSTAYLSLDTKTWLPDQVRREDISEELFVRYRDYREVAGVTLAHRIESSQAGIDGYLQASRAAAAPADRGLFAIPTGPPADTLFDMSLGAEVELRRVRSGHLLVHPMIDEQDVGWFILDTGAGRMCIDPKLADELGLPEFGELRAVGTGGSVSASLRKGKLLTLGPLEMKNPIYVELDLAFLEPVFGVPVAGICGYELFARAVLELDLEGPRLALHDPATYHLERGAWSELTLEAKLPTVRCKFEGDREGRFKIDTGASGGVLFFSPAVDELGLLEGRKVSDSQIGGVGGMVPVKAGTLEWFEVGGHRFEPANATFGRGDEGILAGETVLGNIGTQLLDPFTVVFDYAGGRVAFVPLSE